MAMTDNYAFAKSGLWIKRSLLLYISVLAVESLACLAVVAALWGAADLEPGSSQLRLAGVGLLAMSACGLIQLIVYIAIVVLFLRLLYKAVQKARDFSTPFSYVSPGWAVGYWFIPLMNLYRPLEVVKALFKACAAQAGADAKPKAGEQLLGAWWAFWILGNIVSWIFFRMDTDMSTQAGIVTYVEFDLGLNLLLIAGALLFMQVVKRLVEAVSDAGEKGSPNPA
jgi:hypothetical protein